MNYGIIQALTQTPPPEHIKAIANILKTKRGLDMAHIAAAKVIVLPKSVRLPTACPTGKAA